MMSSSLPGLPLDCGFENSGALPDAGWSRRNFLGVLSMLSAGMAAATMLPVAADAAIEGAPLHDPAARRSFYDPVFVAKTPSALTAQCDLTQDLFLIQNRKIDPTKGDKVIAYSRTDGEVEAVLLQDQSVRVIYRDPTQAGGWNEYPVPNALGVTDMVAGITNPSGPGGPLDVPLLTIFYLTSSDPGQLYVATEAAPDGNAVPNFSRAPTKVGWNSGAGPLQIALNADNSLLVTAMVPSSGVGKTDAVLCYYTDALPTAYWARFNIKDFLPSSGTMTGFEYSPQKTLGLETNWSAVVSRPAHVSGNLVFLNLFLPGTDYTADPKWPSLKIWYYPIIEPLMNEHSNAAIFFGSTTGPMQPASNLTVVSVDFATVLGSQYEPTMLVRTMNLADDNGPTLAQQLWILTRTTGLSGKWAWTSVGAFDFASGSALPLCTATAPAPDTGAGGVTSFLDIFALPGDTVSVIRQAPTGSAVTDATNPVYCPPIPLQGDVAVVTSQAGQSTGNELLLVGTDGTLQALVKDPVSDRWADSVIHLPASELLLEVTTYRVQLDLVDNWNQPMAGQQLQIIASTPATALIEGAAVSLSQTPTSVQTDAHGQVILALIADGLSAPTLTITGGGLSATATVYPSGPINTYMQGATSLNYQTPLTAATLQTAQTVDTPAKTVVPAGADTATATTNMATAASWGANPPPSAHGSATVLGPRDGTLPHHHQRGRRLSETELKSFASDINNWKNDALHAIKKGVAAIDTITADVENRTIELAGDFTEWAQKTVEVVVHGIEDAAHAIHGILNKIGAAIEDAVNWLKAEVLGLLSSTAALATQYDTWITYFCTQYLPAQLDQDATKILAWLQSKRVEVGQQFTALANGFDSKQTLFDISNPTTLNAHRPDRRRRPKPPPHTARPQVWPSPLAAVGDSSADSGTPHANWLLNKIKNAIFGELSTGSELAGFADLLATLGTTIETAATDFGAAFGDFWEFLKSAVSDPKTIGTLGVALLVQAIAKLTDAAFELAEGVVETLLPMFAKIVTTIPDILLTSLDQCLPIVGKLLDLIGLGSVKIGTIATLLFAFPTTLAYQIKNGGHGRPFSNLTRGTSTRHRVGDVEKTDLQLAAAAALDTWAGMDALSDIFIAIAEGADNAVPVPALFTVVDIVAPVIVTFLTVPAINNGNPYHAPPIAGDNASTANFASWILGFVPALCTATSTYIDANLKDAPGAAEWKSSAAWMNTFGGLFSMGFGIIGNHTGTDAPKPTTDATSVLNNMGNIITPLLNGAYAKETEGTSVAIATAITAFCGLGGASVYGSAPQ